MILAFPPRGLLLMAAAWLAASTVLHAQLTFEDTWEAASATVLDDGTYRVNTKGSATAYISLPMTNVDITLFNTATPFALTIAGGVYSGSLGDDVNYSAGQRNVLLGDGLKVSWTSTTVTIVLSAKTDALNEEGLFAQQSSYAPSLNTGPISGPYEVSVQLGNFSYDNQNVYVTGHNTEREYQLAPGAGVNIAPLETGWIRGYGDLTAPSLVITSPAKKVTITDGKTSVPLAGRATDNRAVAVVQYYVNGDSNNIFVLDSPQNPATKVDWQGDFFPYENTDAHPGTNLLTVVAYDATGNAASSSRTIVWIQTNSAFVTVSPAGAGSTKGLQTGQIVNEGFTYPVTATASNHDWIFSYWTDTNQNIISPSPSFGYVATNGGLVANFVPNPYNNTGLAGVYSGLFFNADNDNLPNNLGYMEFTLAPSGVYSGKLYLGDLAKPVPYTGQLTFSAGNDVAIGDCTVQVGKSEFLDIPLWVAVDTNLNDSGAGTFICNITAYSDRAEENLLWDSQAQGEISLYNSGTLPGTYNVAIAPAVPGDTSAGPGGYSYGTATVNTNGTVIFMMNLADGVSRPISFSSSLAQDGTCPFYASLYGGQGVILGWVQFATNGSGGIQGGSVYWSKLPVAGKFYAKGFSANPNFGGALYFPPQAGTNIFGWTDGALNLGGAETFDLSFDPAEESLSATNFTLKFDPSTGLVTGEYVPSRDRLEYPFHALEMGGAAVGFFLTNNGQTAPIVIAALINAPNPAVIFTNSGVAPVFPEEGVPAPPTLSGSTDILITQTYYGSGPPLPPPLASMPPATNGPPPP